MTNQEAKALFQVIEPLLPHHGPILRGRVKHLKQSGGEDWAVGEMLERACILLDAWGQHGGLPNLESEEPLAEGWAMPEKEYYAGRSRHFDPGYGYPAVHERQIRVYLDRAPKGSKPVTLIKRVDKEK